jgi:maltose/moltooligosaccharide transporter
MASNNTIIIDDGLDEQNGNRVALPRLPVWAIINMSFGFLGIQYGFGLQQANMSGIYRYLGADEGSIPGLWLAGPLTGLLIQPIIGAMSDRTWSDTWGRRKPYILIGAIITSIALILMPNSSSVWMAAGLMWMLDGGLNIAMEPFRAFIGDNLKKEQQATGFSIQSFFVGFGQTLANLMPWILPMIGIALVALPKGAIHEIPDSVRYPFYIGSVTILIAVLVTFFTTKEHPPQDMEAFQAMRAKSGGIGGFFKELIEAIREMPKTMRQLWWVKFFTWYGLPLMWQYLSLAVARYVYNAPNAQAPGFEDGMKWGSFCFAMFNVACFGISLFLPSIAAALSRRVTHALFLTIGGIGFILMLFFPTKDMFLIGMILIGLSWGSIMSMPYLLLANSVPKDRMGVYMGIFNGFICIPSTLSMLTVPLFYNSLLGGDPTHALALGGVFLLLAAGACFLVTEDRSSLT